MHTATSFRVRAVRTCLLAAAAMLLVVAAGHSYLSADDESVSIVGVEESWELVVTEPDVDIVAPQVTVAISPTGDLDGLYAALELNHQSETDFSAGGLQLQVWNGGDAPILTRGQKNDVRLSQNNETITWTQKMDLADGQLTFSVANGQSSTWGAFGEPLSATVATTLTDLNSYNPLVSVDGSGVGFASNRVTSLKLKSVKVRLSTGQVLEDNSEKVAFPKE